MDQSSRAKRILIVDNNRDGTDSLSRLISLTFHCEVKIAYDGLTGIKIARTFHPDIIIMDIGMPSLNGYDATKLLRKWYKGTLIALTGWCNTENVQQALDSGFDEHIAKPITLETLTRLLK